jgi:hypothetical protein
MVAIDPVFLLRKTCTATDREKPAIKPLIKDTCPVCNSRISFMGGESIELFQNPPAGAPGMACNYSVPTYHFKAVPCIIAFCRISEADLMLPMGTIVTVCMLIGLVVAAPLALINKLPPLLRKACACVVLAAGLWNVLWYGLRHLFEFWGMAALLSGVLMITTAAYVLIPSRLPGWIRTLKPAILIMLSGCALLYAITIARL